jgi:hypothetical protein
VTPFAGPVRSPSATGITIDAAREWRTCWQLASVVRPSFPRPQGARTPWPFLCTFPECRKTSATSWTSYRFRTFMQRTREDRCASAGEQREASRASEAEVRRSEMVLEGDASPSRATDGPPRRGAGSSRTFALSAGEVERDCLGFGHSRFIPAWRTSGLNVRGRPRGAERGNTVLRAASRGGKRP